jgi:hypothetical protein
MSSWSSSDAYTSAPLWALLQVNKAPTLANMGPVDSAAVELLFKNEEADDFITGVTVGLFNYTASEMSSGHTAADGSTQVKALGAHQGWILRTTGSGGRANRIQSETLVCLTT